VSRVYGVVASGSVFVCASTVGRTCSLSLVIYFSVYGLLFVVNGSTSVNQSPVPRIYVSRFGAQDPGL
jgi:hypothetical protein